jgi:uncharacterized membrane protein YfcA
VDEVGVDAKSLLLWTLGAVAVAFAWLWATVLRDEQRRVAPTATEVAVGAVTNFFDTLGIGSYATTTTIFRGRRMVEDEDIPGTLNVGHVIPTFAQAFIYTEIVKIDAFTLISMIVAAVAGAWLGAGVVAGLEKRSVQRGMGMALLAAAALILARLLGLLPPGGEALSLAGPTLIAGLVGNFVLGALMPLGIGLYAPCMILVSLLGMEPMAAFPIMMGSCAFLMPAANVRFLRAGRYAPAAAVGLAIGGLPATLVAAFLVKTLPLDMVRWLVVGVVGYTAIGMIRAGRAA